MGLDSSLYKRPLKPILERALNRLMEEEDEQEEVLYWRKNYNLLDWFDDIFGGVGNCEDYEVTQDIFEKWLEALENGELNHIQKEEDIEVIKKILKENDFEKTKYYFHNWW